MLLLFLRLMLLLFLSLMLLMFLRLMLLLFLSLMLLLFLMSMLLLFLRLMLLLIYLRFTHSLIFIFRVENVLFCIVDRFSFIPSCIISCKV